MKMQNPFLSMKLYIPLVAAVMMLMSSCGKKREPEPVPSADIKRVTLVYAVNYSSLSSIFGLNTADMLRALEKAEKGADRLLVYRTDSPESTGLYEAVNSNGIWNWKLLREYQRNTTSTNPEKLNKVLEDVCAIYPGVKRTLYFWGHGTSWTPYFSSHLTGHDKQRHKLVAPQGFGGEYAGTSTDWMDLDGLADAIPDNAFDIIWFDCCYMSSMEVAYELRDKAEYLIAYPSEVWDKGLNYADAMPPMLREMPDIKESAQTFFEYYNKSTAVTVAVMDLGKIEPVAAAVARIVADFDWTRPVNTSNYRRGGSEAYHDLRQLMAERAADNPEYTAELDRALADFIIYHDHSQTDFNGRKWLNPDLSDISVYNFRDASTQADRYYQTLDWYKAVYNN